MATSNPVAASPSASSYATYCPTLRTAVIGLIAFGAIAAIVGGALAHAKIALHAWESKSVTLMTVGGIALVFDGGVLCLTRKSDSESKSTAQIPESITQLDPQQVDNYRRRLRTGEFMVFIQTFSGNKKILSRQVAGQKVIQREEPYTDDKYRDYGDSLEEVAPEAVILRPPAFNP